MLAADFLVAYAKSEEEALPRKLRFFWKSRGFTVSDCPWVPGCQRRSLRHGNGRARCNANLDEEEWSGPRRVYGIAVQVLGRMYIALRGPRI